MRMTRRDVIRDQKSVWFMTDTRRRGRSARLDNLYVDLVPRDIPLHVMPIGGSSKARTNFAVTIDPHDEKLERIIASALSEHGNWYSVSEIRRVVCNFVHRVATRLMQHDEAVFEIVTLRDPETNDLVGCDLFEIDADTLTLRDRSARQLVPPEIAAEREVPTVIELDTARLAVFSVPSEFRKGLITTREALSQLGITGLAQMYEASRSPSELGYDIKEHIRAEQLAIAAATRRIGWNANQNLYELFTEYYVLHRRLVFEGFIVSLRESILQQLNEAVAKIAKLFGTTGQLIVSGLPTLQDVSRAKRELASGSRTFSSVLDDFTLL
jgi:hypothetical protein